MNEKQLPFWKRKTLDEMSKKEWESLCDCCGLCCLEKLEDKVTRVIEFTPIACEYMDLNDGRCMIYEDRIFINPDCIQLTPELLRKITWLPETCAYRCVDEGRDLEWWHPLISGNPDTVHKAGISICDKAVSGKYVHFP